MIKSSKYATVIYTNHEINFVIAIEIKLSTINIDKLNLKLIKTFTYFSQFRLDVKHRSRKSNVISNALSRFSNKTSKKNNLDVNVKNSKIDRVYAYAIAVTKISSNFRKMLSKKYDKNSI